MILKYFSAGLFTTTTPKTGNSHTGWLEATVTWLDRQEFFRNVALRASVPDSSFNQQ
jgi:hypothetical protein